MFSSSDSDVSLQARKIIEFISYQTRKSSDVSTKFDSDLKSLSEQCDSKEFESKLELLGKYLGASSKRYDDNGDGPDVAGFLKKRILLLPLKQKTKNFRIIRSRNKNMDSFRSQKSGYELGIQK